MKILVVGPSWIGDMVISQSFYCSLKMHYPQSTIDVIAPIWCYSLLFRMPEVNEVVITTLDHGILAIRERRRLGYSLRAKKYDRAYILPNSFKSALIPFFAKIPYRIGWCGELRYGVLNKVRILDKKAFPMMVERYIALSYEENMEYNLKNLSFPKIWPHLQVFENEKSKIFNVFNISKKRPVIGFCPGAEFGPAKRWPHYHYAELAKKLIKEGYQILILGSKKEYEESKEIYSILTREQQLWCYNLVGKTLLEEAVLLIAICKAIVTNDSGLMHVSAALNRPLVALYGPSSPDFTPPLSNRARVIRLITGYYKIRRGRTEQGYHQSLIDISPQKVLDELINLLSTDKD